VAEACVDIAGSGYFCAKWARPWRGAGPMPYEGAQIPWSWRMTETTPWTARSLKTALESAPQLAEGELTARIMEGAEPILLVVMHDFGDLEIFVSAGEQQIAASALLWPVDEQEDRHAFNEFLLKAQKIVPLSNFGISTVGDRDFYELFGELATTTPLDTIVIELRTLAENAIGAASELRSAFSTAA
jgi:uncharacterized protein YjfI (DUF2170 family)